MNDSIKIIKHAPYKPVQPKVRIETPIGAIESDSGNHVVDGITVIVIILILYVCKKLINKGAKGRIG